MRILPSTTSECKNCGQLHPSPVAFGDKKSFDTATLRDNAFQCPKRLRIASNVVAMRR